MDEIHHCKLYNWLTQSNSIETCRNQIDASKALQRIELFVDSLALLEFDSYLGNCLLGNYMLFCKLVQEVLVEVFKEAIESINQLLCVIRPTCFVTMDESDLTNAADSTALVCYWARVIALRDPISYTQSTKYNCSDELCSHGTKDSAHIRVYTLKSRECDVINPNLHCVYCNECLFEDVSKRVLGRRMIITVQLLQTGERNKMYFVESTKDIIVRDELISKITLGSRVSIVGLEFTKCDYTTNTKKTILEAVNIENADVPLPHLIPRSIREIYSVRERSPWQLLSLLAFCVTPSGVPQGAFHTLKQVLLLSLVETCSVESRDSPLFLPTAHPHHQPCVNVLVRSRDTLMTSRVMRAFTSLAQISETRGGYSICGTRDGNLLNIGLLTSIPGGVAFVGDIDLLRKEDRALLESSLQNRAAVIGKKKTEVFALKCSLWGYQSVTSKMAPTSPWDIVLQVTKDYDDDSTINVILQEEQESLLPECDLKSYLALASIIQVKFESECTTLIAAYCQAAKSVRYGSNSELPLQASYSIHLLAANHAKINFRHLVLDVDAVAAIKLYEECLYSSHNYSCVDVK